MKKIIISNLILVSLAYFTHTSFNNSLMERLRYGDKIMKFGFFGADLIMGGDVGIPVWDLSSLVLLIGFIMNVFFLYKSFNSSKNKKISTLIIDSSSILITKGTKEQWDGDTVS
jgi:hypothetical protein